MDSLLIINIIAGGFVGYITKTLAINMLFKEYPIIGGAEIIKDRENLGISLSKLVEEELVKPSTLLEEFQKEPFRKSFEELIKHILENTLNKNINEINNINNIKGFDKTVDNLKDFLIKNQDKILNSTTDSLFKNININDILSKEQIDYIIQFIIQVLYKYIYDNLENLLKNLSEELKDKKINDFLDDKLIDKLITNLLNNDLSINIDIYLDLLYKNLNINSLINEIFFSVKDKKISEILYYKKDSNINYHLINTLINFINSEIGFNLLNKIISHLIEILKSLDISISSFLTEKIENKLFIFLENNLPKIIEYLEEWFFLNKVEIEKLINSSIDEHLESEQILKKLLGIIFAQKLAERYELVETTLNEIKKISGSTKSQITDILNKFLNNLKISDVFKFLDDKLIDSNALTIALINILNNYLPKFDKSIPENILNKKINDIPILKDIDIEKVFEKKIYPYLKTKISQDLSQDLEKSSIKKFLLKQILKFKVKNISSFFNTELYLLYKEVLLKNITKKEIWDFILDKVSKFIPKVIKNKKMSDFIPLNIKNELIPKFSNLYKIKISDFLLSVKNTKISSLYQKTLEIYTNLCNSKAFSKKLSETLINMMNKLIKDNKLLDGKIFVAVNESFVRFTDIELKEEMNSFMGKELQPIKLLGTILGALIGVGMYFMSFVPNYGQYVTGWWGLLSYSFIYGITEVGTNWLVIKMLFKPYKSYSFLGINLPFTPGVFPKNKEALSKSMANFIDKKLLSKENMIEILERYHYKWKEVIKGVISKNNYSIIDETIKEYTKENYDEIAPIIIDIGFNEINKNKEIISNYIVDELKNINKKNIDFEDLKLNINDNIEYSLEKIIKNLKIFIFNEKIEYLDKKIINILSPEIVKIIPSLLESLLNFILKKLLVMINEKDLFVNILSLFENELRKKIDELLGKDLSELAKIEIISFIETTIKDNSAQEIFFDIIEKYLLKELSSNKSIKNIFNGKIISILLNESDFIIEVLINYLLNIAKNKKDLLVKIIALEIEKKGLLESFMIKFGGVKKDIYSIVNLLIDEKLDFYLNNKKNEIGFILKKYIKNEVSNIKLSDFGLDNKVLDFDNLKQLVYDKIIKNEEFFNILSKIINNLYTNITKNISINQILNSFDIKISEEILENELNIIKKSLSNSIKINKENIIDNTNHLIFNYINNILEKNSLNSIFKNIDKEELYISIENIVSNIFKSKNFYEIKDNLLDDIFDILNKDTSKIIDFEILKKDLTHTINLLTDNKVNNEFQNDIIENIKWLIIDFIDILNKNVEGETKEFFENILVNSLVDSLRINNREILAPIDFNSIVRKEVYAMEPSRIEAIFDFAKPIFKLLIWYGALGSIIGLGVGFFELFH